MELRDLSIDDIQLDRKNPRLPEHIRDGTQSEILRYLFDHAVLDELARSLLDNGYFQHEPLLVTEEDGQWVVLEGNRRLAALKILLARPDAQEVDLRFDLDGLTPARRAELSEVPSYVVDGRTEVRRYLGFRHIGGIKTWSAEAKARYLVGEVDRAAAGGADRPFLDVARRVGSNTQGVRNSYIAMSILQHAREESGIDISYVQHNRFGVWLRAINSPELRSFIAFGDPRTYEEVREALDDVEPQRVREVLLDLTPPRGREKAVLADSRDVTIYARVLTNSEAHAALRKYEDLSVARQIVEQADLPARVERVRRAIDLIVQEVHRVDVSEELAEAVEDLFGVVRSLVAITRARPEDVT